MRWGVLGMIVLLVAGSAEARRPKRDPAKQKAAAHLDAGQVAFDVGEYPAAIAEWQQAYQLGKDPKVLFLLGDAFRLSGECNEAVRHYRSYLTLAPSGDKRAQAESQVSTLRCATAIEPPKPPEPVPVPVEPPKAPEPAPEPAEIAPRAEVRDHSDGRGLRVTGFLVGTAGVALAVTGGYFALSAKDKSDDVTFACRVRCQWGELQELESTGKRNQTLGLVLLSAGGVAVVSGIVLYVVGASRGHRVDVAATPTSMGVVWSGTF